MPKLNLGMSHISPLDYGWWVRFHRTNGKGGQYCYLHKVFTFKECGGIDKALNAAMKWRDEQYPAHLATKDPVHQKTAKKNYRARPNNATGVLGVQRGVKIRKNGEEYVYYAAVWRQEDPETGKRKGKTKSFAVGSKRTEAQALKQAKAHRKKMEKLHYRQWTMPR